MFRSIFLQVVKPAALQSSFYTCCLIWTPLNTNPRNNEKVLRKFEEYRKTMSFLGEAVPFEKWLKGTIADVKRELAAFPTTDFETLDAFCAAGVPARDLRDLIEEMHSKKENRVGDDLTIRAMVKNAISPVASFIRVCGKGALWLWQNLGEGEFEELVIDFHDRAHHETWYFVFTLLSDDRAFTDLVQKGKIDGLKFGSDLIRSFEVKKSAAEGLDLGQNQNMIFAMKERARLLNQALKKHENLETTIAVNLQGKTPYQRLLQFFNLVERLIGEGRS